MIEHRSLAWPGACLYAAVHALPRSCLSSSASLVSDGSGDRLVFLSKVEELATTVGADWPNLAAARSLSAERYEQIVRATERYPSTDVSIVAFGSLARQELTSGSDPDWTLLVDGAADPNHLDTAYAVGRELAELFAKEPGREQTFGTPTFSHDLVHQIGGQDDSNRNTTRRILLLLESVPIGRREAYDRVVNSVLIRYLLEDRTFALKRSKHHVPRFLFNDIARYWRTMAVDFAYKARSRQGKGFAIRNFKLRMSRKLIYISGMLSCFACELGMLSQDWQTCPTSAEDCVGCLRGFMCRPPLEVLADVLLRLGTEGHEAARKILGSYDEFIGVLADERQRAALETLGVEGLDADGAFDTARDISHRFRDGVLALFFDVKPIADLTRIYGVF